MVCQHDVMVAVARAKREATHVVCVELAGGIDIDMGFVGSGVWDNGYFAKRRSGAWFGVVLMFGICGTDSLLGPSEVALDFFIT